MKSTFIQPNGVRLEVRPSPTRAGIWLIQTRPDHAQSITIVPLEQAAIVAQAMVATATAIEEGRHPVLDDLPAHALGAAA